jgi:hypothetical protein
MLNNIDNQNFKLIMPIIEKNIPLIFKNISYIFENVNPKKIILIGPNRLSNKFLMYDKF